jgi:hypothetical protein
MLRVASRRNSVNASASRPPALDWPTTPEIDAVVWSLSPEDQRWAAENLNDGYDSETPADFVFPDPPESDFDRDAEVREAEARLTNGHLL